MTLFVTHFVVNELSLHAVGKVLVAAGRRQQKGVGGNGQISSIQAIHGTEKGSFGHQLELLLYRTTIHRCQKPTKLTGGSNHSRRALPVADGTVSKWMKNIHQPMLFHLELPLGNVRASQQELCWLVSSSDRGGPAVSYKWTGWVWVITGWSSRLQENYRSL